MRRGHSPDGAAAPLFASKAVIMSRFIDLNDLTGQRFGRLIVLRIEERGRCINVAMQV